MMAVASSKRTLSLWGSGHGARAAFQSLSAHFRSIVILSEDMELRRYARETDILALSPAEAVADVVVCAGYSKLISADLLGRALFINTHPSLLPKYRGMHSLVWAILNGESKVGFSIHLMNEEVDDGDILEQFSVEVNGMTSKQLWDIIDDYVLRNLGRVVSNFLDGKIIPKPQDSTHATWVPKRNLDDCFVDFSMSLDRMDAFFRALVSPYPLPRIRIRGQTYEILQAEVIGREYFCSIGRVVAHHKSSALIKFSGGLLAVNKLSDLATGGIVPAQSILRVGERL